MAHAADTMRRRSVLAGLVGEGIGPSLTPSLHELEGERHGLAYVYRTFDLARGEGTADRLRSMLVACRRWGFDGLNVTHPVKQAVIPLLHDLTPTARSVGAVNTVLFEGDRLVGHNTDVTGFRRAFDESLPDAAHDRVVVLGAGGAGAAVASALLGAGAEELVIVDPDERRAAALAASLRESATGTVSAASPVALPGIVGGVDGIVNATPIGMAAHPGQAVRDDLLHARLFVVDIVYRPVQTALLRAATARGCRVMSGLGMVLHQAADAFEVFTGETADRQAMLGDLESLVASEVAAATAGAPAG